MRQISLLSFNAGVMFGYGVDFALDGKPEGFAIYLCGAIAFLLCDYWLPRKQSGA